MNPPKCDELDYIHFLIAAQKVFSNVEAAKSHPAAASAGPAHDAYTRLLQRCQSDDAALWAEVQPCVPQCGGMLVLDDTTLDKPYAHVMGLVTRHWSGKHRAVVQGINLITLLWTDGAAHWPCDFRIYDSSDGLTKNDIFGPCWTVRPNAACSRDWSRSTVGTPVSIISNGCVSWAGIG
jgi:putative transposase